ncbi:MAG: hypothetical protein R3B84_14510 [Zavarzinella sp.]
MLALIIGAGILGLIISFMDDGEFPGWGKMLICVFAALLPASIINYLLPPELFFIGLTVGAICATFAIMATCGMTIKEAAIAAGIYLGIQIALTLGIRSMF